MKNWPIKPLEEIADVYGGSTPSRDNPSFWGGDIHWATPTDLPMPDQGISVVSSTKDTLTQAGLDDSSATIMPIGTVLFSSRATIGKVAVAAIPLATNQGFANFVPRSGMSPRFLAYSLWGRRYDIARLSGSTTFKEVSRSTIRKYQIPVPPIADQVHIVTLLDEADRLRTLRAEADRRTAALIPALFHEMFGDPIANPRGWRKKELRELGRVVTGGTPPSAKPAMFNGRIPFITPGDLENNTRETMRYVTEAGAAEVRTLRPGATLVCCIGATIGKTDRTWTWSTFNQQINAVEWGDEIDDDFGVVCMKESAKVVIQQGSQTALPILKKSLFEQIQIPVPPVPLQKEFAHRVTEIHTLEAGQATSRTSLDTLFESMLHRAFAGEL